MYYGKAIASKFTDFLKIMSGVTLGFVSGGGLLLFQYPSKLDYSLKEKLLGESREKKMGQLMDL